MRAVRTFCFFPTNSFGSGRADDAGFARRSRVFIQTGLTGGANFFYFSRAAVIRRAFSFLHEDNRRSRRKLKINSQKVESKKDWAGFDKQAALANSSKTRTAHAAQFKMPNDAQTLFDVVVIHGANDDKFREFRGIEDFPRRPLSDFKWITEDVLQFEQ